jgi:hypothetical protein
MNYDLTLHSTSFKFHGMDINQYCSMCGRKFESNTIIYDSNICHKCQNSPILPNDNEEEEDDTEAYSEPEKESPLPPPFEEYNLVWNPNKSLLRMEEEIFLTAHKHFNGMRRFIARSLKISMRTVRNRISELKYKGFL